MKRIVSALLLVLVALPALAVEPSENAGCRGTYPCTTRHEGYNYYVYVPKSYADENPAGLHLFFHGQGGQGGASSFGLWAKDFLEPHNLIGINTQYMDGDNMRDTEGKVAAAVEAIQQTLADYKVLRGRGVVCSFSGGGLPHGLLTAKYGQKRGDWPFSHAGLYGSNYPLRLKDVATMSWFLGLGTGEWTLAGAGLGRTRTQRTEELLQLAVAGGCPDVYLKITKGKGHSISNEDRIESAKQFGRSVLLFGPLVYAADYAEPDLAKIVDDANDLNLGDAGRALRRLHGRKELDETLRKKGERIAACIDAHVEKLLSTSKELVENDPLLADYYGKRFLKQLKGHPKEGELKKLFDGLSKKSERDARGALKSLSGAVTQCFTPAGELKPEAEGFLRKIRSKAGEKSLLGTMAGEFLLLLPASAETAKE